MQRPQAGEHHITMLVQMSLTCPSIALEIPASAGHRPALYLMNWLMPADRHRQQSSTCAVTSCYDAQLLDQPVQRCPPKLWWSRLSQLTVRLTPERSCWVALPPALLNRLYDAGVPLPLAMELRPAGPSGEVHALQ